MIERDMETAGRWMDMQHVTKTDVGATEWMITDDVVGLRMWGSRTCFALPPIGSAGDWIIGAAQDCCLSLADPRGLTSGKHARVVHNGTTWLISDLHSKNGLRVDGARCLEAVLRPGLELGIGSNTLIVESPRLIALRRLLERFLGWTDDCARAVDQALRSLRLAATRRAALVVCGDDDLVQIARELHDHTLGPGRPFVVCDPRRRTTSENVRSAENYNTCTAAMQAATGGSLCIWASRLPGDFDDAQRSLRDPSSRSQVIVCGRAPSDAGILGCAPIIVPSLAARPGDVSRIVEQYAAEAAEMLGMSASCFTSIDREWVREHAAVSFAEIAKATRRLIAIRATGNLNQAAACLGMARASLHKWIGRRSLPMLVDK